MQAASRATAGWAMPLTVDQSKIRKVGDFAGFLLTLRLTIYIKIFDIW
jgi:hypothetical protein